MIQIHVMGWRIPISRTISNNRFFQIKRYLYVSSPGDVANWWEKLEPLNSKIRENCMKYYLPSTLVMVDEMKIRFGVRSKYTILMHNKPIIEGYKVSAICDHSYTLNWKFHSRVKGIAELSFGYRESIGIFAPTLAVVYQLAILSLPYAS